MAARWEGLGGDSSDSHQTYQNRSHSHRRKALIATQTSQHVLHFPDRVDGFLNGCLDVSQEQANGANWVTVEAPVNDIANSVGARSYQVETIAEHTRIEQVSRHSQVRPGCVQSAQTQTNY